MTCLAMCTSSTYMHHTEIDTSSGIIFSSRMMDLDSLIIARDLNCTISLDEVCGYKMLFFCITLWIFGLQKLPPHGAMVILA